MSHVTWSRWPLLLAALSFLGCESQPPADSAPAPKGKEEQAAAQDPTAPGEAPVADDSGTPAQDPPAQPEATPTPVVPPAAADPAQAETLNRVAKRLPATASQLYLAPTVLALSDALGREALMEKLAPLISPVQEEIRQVTGQDLTSPEGLRAIGLRPEGFAGLAVLDLPSGTFAFFVEVADAKTVTDFIDKIFADSQTEVERQATGDTTLWKAPSASTPGILVSADMAMIVVSVENAPPAELFSLAALAELPLAQSLAADAKFQAAMQRLDGRSDLVAYLDFPGLATHLARGEDNSALYEAEIARAEADGNADFAEILRGLMAAEAAHVSQEQRLLQAFVQPLGHLTAALSLEGAAARAVLRVSAPTEYTLRRALREHPGTPRLLQAQNQQPLVFLSAAIDTAQLPQLIDWALAGEEMDFAAMAALAKEEVGLDLQALLTQAISGEVALAVTGQLDFSAPDPAAALGFDFVLGMGEGKDLETIVSLLFARPEVSALIKNVSGRYVMDIPNWRKVYLGFTADALWISTDPALPTRLQEGGTYLAGADATTRAALGEAHAVLVAVDPKVFYGTFATQSSRAYPISSVSSAQPERAAELAKYQELRRELDRLDLLAAEHERAQLDETFQVFGLSILSLRADEQDLSLRITQLTPLANVAAAISALVDAGSASLRPEVRADLAQRQRLLVEVEELQEALFNGPTAWDAADLLQPPEDFAEAPADAPATAPASTEKGLGTPERKRPPKVRRDAVSPDTAPSEGERKLKFGGRGSR